MNYHFNQGAYAKHCAADRGEHKAERTLLGLVLVDPSKIEIVKGSLDEQDFQFDRHRNIYAAILGIHSEGRVPSKAEILDVWQDPQFDDAMSMGDYISGLIAEALPEIQLPIEGIIDHVREKAQRVMLAEASKGLASAMAGSRSIPEVGREAIEEISCVMALVGENEKPGIGNAELIEIAKAELAGDGKKGPQTGFTDIDKRIGGWPLAQLSIVAARPGMGKSAFAVSAALNIAKQSKHTLLFSLEMTNNQIAKRILCDLAYVDMDPVCYQDLGERDLPSRHQALIAQAMEKFRTMTRIEVQDRPGASVENISLIAKRYAAELRNRGKSLDAIFVDHIGIMTPTMHHAGRRDREIADITIGLARLAKVLDIPVIALCQLNRAVEGRENKRPTLSDLRDSGAIEEDASLVLMLYRSAYYLERARYDSDEDELKRKEKLEQVRHKLEVGIEKNRNGATGRVDLFINVGANAVRDASFKR